MSVRLGRFMERSGVLPTTKLIYRKGLGTWVHICASSIDCSPLVRGQEHKIVPIDFGAAFDRINHHGILYEHCSVGIWKFHVAHWHSFYQIDICMLLWTVFGVNWLTLYQECRRAVFWAFYSSSCTPFRFFPFWRIS